MKKIIIIDGYSLLFRAYYATAYPGVEILRNHEGTPTNAIFAFSNMLNKIISSLKEGEGLFVALDTGGTTFRKVECETYKANRKPCPEDLKVQFPIARKLLESLNVYFYEKEGYEGDDIAGSVAKQAEKEGYEVLIYTSDRDYLQLIDEKISVNIIKKGLSDVLLMTPEVVQETYGIKPIQIIDYKGLRGDSSDNLPGIPGIGEKTAIKLIQEYDSFDNIIAHADDIKGKLGQTIKENVECGKLSRDLAIIKTDIELPFKIIETTYKGYDFNSINEFCQKYDLKTFMNKVSPKWKIASEQTEEISISSLDELNNIIDIKEVGIAIDLDGNYQTDPLLGVAISINKKNFYFNEDNLNNPTLKNILEDKNIAKYCYDYKAIKVALNRYDIHIEGLKFDLLIAAYLLDSSLKNNVDQVMHTFGVDIDEKVEPSLFENSNPIRTAKTAYYAYKLYNKALSELEKFNMVSLYNDLELPLSITLADMEIEGFPLDKETLDKFGDEFKNKITILEKEIYELAGEKFNIASTKQLGEILFNKLGLSSNKKGSTSFDNLKDLIDKHPIISKIIEYRKYAKLVSTYIDGLKPFILNDGKIHAHFNQALTTTGRLSSSEPNLQNISVRDEDGKLIRKAFFYPNNEYEILSLDYSQIELRILAYLSKAKGLENIFKTNEDIHSATAKKLFKVEGQPTNEQRRKAKTVNFGIVYGISEWGLADQLDISAKEAKEIIKSFYSEFPEVSTFFADIVNDAKNNGYVTTLSGRRRYLREIYDTNYQVREFAKRAAMNAPIQGTAADLIKIAMIKVDKALKENNFKTKLVLQIHDELLFKVPKEEKQKVYKLVKNIMEHALEISVPLLVDGGFGKDWYSAK